MEESTVVRRVRKWLEEKSEYSKRKGFRVYGRGEEGPIPANVNSGDLLVQKENEIVAQVECKGTYSLLEQDLGQCLCYYTHMGGKKTHGKVKTYLAVPSDYTGVRRSYPPGSEWEIDDVLEILNVTKSPIGLLVVYPNKRIRKRKEPWIIK